MYRSPLLPIKESVLWEASLSANTHKVNISVPTADKWLRYFQKSKRLDTTYASAWELGKWLTLQRKEIASEIYKWKKQKSLVRKIAYRKDELRKSTASVYEQNLSQIEDTIAEVLNKNSKGHPIPKVVKSWIRELVFLEVIPYLYLVPEAPLLPEESIRFFQLDDNWIWVLVDGALSIGRRIDTIADNVFEVKKLNISGFILRSEIVTNFPDIQIETDGYLLSKRLIGKDTMLCLFQNSTAHSIKKVNFSLPTEGMHYGFSKNNNAYKKKFYREDSLNGKLGKRKKVLKTSTFDIEDKVASGYMDQNNRVLDIPEIAKKIKNLNLNLDDSNSSIFAYRMIEATPEIELKAK